ncbi:hypothetical protein BgiMline_019446 [Biomphalaria glabrata]|nr:kappa-type opioid receptor-like [Biomphalaria glabrata]
MISTYGTNQTVAPYPEADTQLSWKISTLTAVLVSPIIAVLGLVGNILSIVAIVKSGWKKPSNVLLTCLCVADSLVLLSAFNVPRIVAFLSERETSYCNVWDFNESISYIFYVVTLALRFLFSYGVKLSSGIVTLITLERFIAVFFPLKLVSVITARRLFVAVLVLVIVWIPWPLYLLSHYTFVYSYYPEWKVYAGNALFNPNTLYTSLHLYAAIPLGLYVPFLIVTSGSILISTKLHFTLKKRKSMVLSSSNKESSKTTKILISVCAVFAITKAASVLEYLADLSDQSDDSRNTNIVLESVIFILDLLNSSSNFVVFVTINTNFKTLFKFR